MHGMMEGFVREIWLWRWDQVEGCEMEALGSHGNAYWWRLKGPSRGLEP